MVEKKNNKTEILRLKNQLKKFQKQHHELVVQSPYRWWHDEYFDNQLKVLEAMIEETKTQLEKLEK